MRKIAINLETQKRNASRSLPVTVQKYAVNFEVRLILPKLCRCRDEKFQGFRVQKYSFYKQGWIYCGCGVEHTPLALGCQFNIDFIQFGKAICCHHYHKMLLNPFRGNVSRILQNTTVRSSK
jgi:hypothetical protein